ncbi:MAG TPA: serine protease [Thermoanaerobaculia bacterium]|nr:serine protease [Thermoanaerobaculia bacterium]
MSHEDEHFDNEAVVRPGRPALMIQDGDFGALPEEWAHLEAKRELFKSIIPSIGRLEIAETNRPVGTAFLAGRGILMTNRHVLESFADPVGDEWRIRPNVTVRVDFREEHGGTTPSELLVEGVIGVHGKYDLALLRVPATLDHIAKVLFLRGSEPEEPIKGREVVVIGYPDFDFTATPEQVTGVFQNVLGVKRLQPGKITGPRQHNNQPIFGHDCSTLGGNSGSCVLDVETGHVLGLHFGGTTTGGNMAVPMWKVARDPLLKDLQWVRKQRAART